MNWNRILSPLAAAAILSMCISVGLTASTGVVRGAGSGGNDTRSAATVSGAEGPFCFTNTTGRQVNDLHALFTGTGGTLRDPHVTVGPAPDQANARGNRVDFTWVQPLAPDTTICFTAVSDHPNIAVNDAYWTWDGQSVGTAFLRADVPSDAIKFKDNIMLPKNKDIPKGKDVKVTREFHFEWHSKPKPKTPNPCSVDSDNDAGQLTETGSPFACSDVTIDGQLKGVNGELTHGTAEATLAVDSADGRFVVPLAITFTATGPELAATHGKESDKAIAGEKGTSENPVVVDTASSTISVTPLTSASGDTNGFTLDMSVQLNEAEGGK